MHRRPLHQILLNYRLFLPLSIVASLGGCSGPTSLNALRLLTSALPTSTSPGNPPVVPPTVPPVIQPPVQPPGTTTPPSIVIALDADENIEAAGQREYVVANLGAQGTPSSGQQAHFMLAAGAAAATECALQPTSSSCWSRFTAFPMRVQPDLNRWVFDFLARQDFAGVYSYMVYVTGSDQSWGLSPIRTVNVYPSLSPTPRDALPNDPSFFTRTWAPPVRDTNLPANPNDMIVVSNGTYGPMGNDQTGNGTLQAPFLTVARAMGEANWRWPNDSARAGKWLVLRGGRYVHGRNSLVGNTEIPANRYDLSFTNKGGIEGNHFHISGYPFDPEPPLIDLYKVAPEQLYNNPDPPGCRRFIVGTGASAIEVSCLNDADIWADDYHSWGPDITNARHLTFEGIAIMGAFVEGLNIDNVYDVRVRFVEIYNARKWGMQAFQWNSPFGPISRLVIEGCVLAGTMLEHGIYLAAGTDGAGPGQDIVVHHNVAMFNGRNGIQANGTHEFLRIEDNALAYNYLTGVTSTGNANVQIKNNLIANNLRQGINFAYSYVDGSYWSVGDVNSMNDWASKHFRTSSRQSVQDNIIVVRNAQNSFHPGLGNNLNDMPAIIFPTDHGVIPNWGVSLHVPHSLEIRHNVIYTASWKAISANNLVDPNHRHRWIKLQDGLRVTDNQFYSEGASTPSFCSGLAQIFCGGTNGIWTLPVMESRYHQPSVGGGFWGGNSWGTLPAFSSALQPVPTIPVPTVSGRINTRDFIRDQQLIPRLYQQYSVPGYGPRN